MKYLDFMERVIDERLVDTKNYRYIAEFNDINGTVTVERIPQKYVGCAEYRDHRYWQVLYTRDI